MDDKIKKELAGKVYGDYNALAINMGVGCDCDPDVKRFIVMDYFECLKPDAPIKR